MSDLRILVVDDDQDFAESLADVLKLEGYRADTVHCGETAVEQCRRQDYQLALLDVRLPGCNGVEVFRKIRQVQPRLRAYMMTGYSVDALLEEALAEGARGVLYKPLDMPQLLEIISEIQPDGILVADDDADYAAAVRELLESRGYRVYAARDGQEALDRVKSGGIELLILDLRLPGLSGLDVYRELQRCDRRVPTIVVTAYGRHEAETLERLRELSVGQIIFKPHDPDKLLAAVDALAGR